jgi:hypothetical protein
MSLFCMFNVIQPGFYQGKQGNMNYLPAYALELYKSKDIKVPFLFHPLLYQNPMPVFGYHCNVAAF